MHNCNRTEVCPSTGEFHSDNTVQLGKMIGARRQGERGSRSSNADASVCVSITGLSSLVCSHGGSG